MKYSIFCKVSKDGDTTIQLTRTFDNTGFERIYASSPSGQFPATLGADKFTACNDRHSIFTPSLAQTLMRLPWYRPGSVLSFIDLDKYDPMYRYNQEILAFRDDVKDKKFLPGGGDETYCSLEVTDDSRIVKINDLFERLGIPRVVNAPGNIETLTNVSAAAQVQDPAAHNGEQDVVMDDSADVPGGPAFK